MLLLVMAMMMMIMAMRSAIVDAKRGWSETQLTTLPPTTIPAINLLIWPQVGG